MSKGPCKQTQYIDSTLKEAPFLLGGYLAEMLEEFSLPPVFVCIGSDRVTGDSLGPMIGSWLKKRYRSNIHVYGTLDLPVHALNLDEIIAHIHSIHQNHPVIAIDASLGTKEHQGYITVGRGSISPGAGVNKSLTDVGDMFITGIVGMSGRFSHISLQTARLSQIISIAEQIAGGIQYAYSAYVTEELPLTPFSYAAPFPAAAKSDKTHFPKFVGSPAAANENASISACLVPSPKPDEIRSANFAGSRK